MDKITRGSRVGEALLQGSWGEVAKVDTVRNARGSHIGDQFKLENTCPKGQKHARSNHTSDTFRTQDWFRHDMGNDTRKSEVPALSSRFWKGSMLGAPSSPDGGRSKSMKNLAEEECFSPDRVPSPRAVDLQKTAGMRQGVARARSVGLLGMWAEPDDVEVSVFNGQSPNKGPRSPRSPRPMQPAGMAIEPRGRGRGDGDEDIRPTKRTLSPTYFASENWMTYSSPRLQTEAADTAGLMPSRNFSSKGQKKHTGRQAESSAFWNPARSEISGEPELPPTADYPITNSINHVPSKGKKTNMFRATQVGGASRRLHQDKSEPEPFRSERQHNFPTHPQSLQQMEEFRLSPRLQVLSSRSPDEVIDMQHRTSAEMASSMMPERLESGPNLGQTKYMVGNEIVSWANCGRRGAPECFGNIQRVAAQNSKEAGGYQAPPPNSMTNPRDHRNSDLIREHLKSGSINWQERLTPAPNAMPSQLQGPSRRPPPPSSVAGLASDTRIFSYGDVSCLPSSMPKDTAYLQSGLKVFKYGARTPGYFSPHMAHAPIVQGGVAV